MGVHLFAGKFQKCVYDNGTIISVDIIKNKTQCNLYNYTWKNERINFDHILSAYLALFHVATFKGWIQIMRNAVDSTTIDQQPYRDASTHNYAYFIIFIIFGSFFTLNLFIGVIIDNFNMQKKKVGETVDLLMTEKQKRLYLAMKKYQTKQPRSAIEPPKNAILKFCFNVVTSQKFDIFIMIIILLNMISMSLEHYNQSKYFTQVLSITNQVNI
ncbi:hypothetical protein A3Q56_07700 [Intoshia linei]|uniref:Ion transport domain-containing protein n=1 Tax=Intoshia linei TaxID=1819745 RepID=A0A177ARJ0_9BILA|nr:hypothetical protein A3Q56_07700 [Intoshia linei]